jgi:hypothetical protein
MERRLNPFVMIVLTALLGTGLWLGFLWLVWLVIG